MIHIQSHEMDNGSLFLLMASVFTATAGYGIVLPILPSLLERLLSDVRQFSVSWHTGMLASIYMLALFAFAPMWGHFSDRIGRRPVILLGLGGSVLALALSGLVGSLGLVYLVRFLSGVFSAAVLPVAWAYVGHTSPPQWRARRFAWMSIASGLGFLAGPALGGALSGAATLFGAQASSASLPFFVVAIMAAVLWVAIYLKLPPAVALDPPRPVKSAAPYTQKTRPLWTLLFLTLLVMFGLGSFEVGITLRGQQTLGFGPVEIGLIFTVCGLVMVGVQAVIFSPLITRFGAGRMLAPAFLVMAAGLWVLPYGTNLTVIGVLVGLTAAGAGVLIPALAYLVSLNAEAFQGKALGRQTAAASLGQALGSIAAGALFGIMAQAPFWFPMAQAPFWFPMALLLLGVGISLATVYATPQPVEE